MNSHLFRYSSLNFSFKQQERFSPYRNFAPKKYSHFAVLPQLRSKRSITFGNEAKKSPFERNIPISPGPGSYEAKMFRARRIPLIRSEPKKRQQKNSIGPGSFATDLSVTKPKITSYSIGRSRRKSFWLTSQKNVSPVGPQTYFHQKKQKVTNSLKFVLAKLTDKALRPAHRILKLR